MVYNKNDIISNVYVSLNVIPIASLKKLQEKLCGEFALIPRKEFHITIGFPGEVSRNSVEQLAPPLANQIPDEIQTIPLEGIGWAVELEGDLELIDINNNDEAKKHSRVLWISVKPLDSFYSLRLKLANAAKAINIDASKANSKYYPHVTIGSGGPGGNDWSSWDVHTIAKKTSYKTDLPLRRIYCDKFHITCPDVHPKSLKVLRSWQ
jgi:2'-5' RNA ligase